MTVEVTFKYEPEPDATDDTHRMGITDDEYVRLCNVLMHVGAEDIEVSKADSSRTDNVPTQPA